MSHVESGQQRAENQRVHDCPNRGTRQTWVESKDPFTGEDTSSWEDVPFNNCGRFERVSAAQDRCTKCNAVFTY